MENSDDAICDVFASNVLWFRTHMGISQEDLAFRADVQRNYVGVIERAESAATLKTVAKLARVFGLPNYELLVKRPEALEMWRKTRQVRSRKVGS